MAPLESAWLDLRNLRDQIGVTRNLGASVSPRGIPLDSLSARAARARARVRKLGDAASRERLAAPDSIALAAILRDLRGMESGAASVEDEPAPPTDCGEAFPAALGRASLDSLTGRTFACYGDAARRIIVGPDTLDRLSILGLLGRTDDPDRRRRLFLALEPVWRSVNGDDAAGSPYRRMVRLRLDD